MLFVIYSYELTKLSTIILFVATKSDDIKDNVFSDTHDSKRETIL